MLHHIEIRFLHATVAETIHRQHSILQILCQYSILITLGIIVTFGSMCRWIGERITVYAQKDLRSRCIRSNIDACLQFLRSRIIRCIDITVIRTCHCNPRTRILQNSLHLFRNSQRYIFFRTAPSS